MLEEVGPQLFVAGFACPETDTGLAMSSDALLHVFGQECWELFQSLLTRRRNFQLIAVFCRCEGGSFRAG